MTDESYEKHMWELQDKLLRYKWFVKRLKRLVFISFGTSKWKEIKELIEEFEV